jgi:hypothetical protein
MAVTRELPVLLGTDESTGATVSNNTTSTGSEQDILAGTVSFGFAHAYLKYTSSAAAGSVVVKLSAVRVSGQTYAVTPLKTVTFTPINGTERRFLGTIPVSRLMVGSVQNLAVGADLTNVFLALELFKVS